MDCSVQPGREASFSSALQQLQSDRARYHYESYQIERARLSLLNSQELTIEQSRILQEWIDYAAYMLNPDPVEQDVQPF